MQTLRLFCEVVRRRSFSEAASIHGVTQSAASQRVSQLEKRLGVELINRGVRPLGLTEAGKRFHEGCEQVIHRYDSLERQVCGIGQIGRIRVAAIYSAGIDLLSQIREQFEASHEQIRVEISYDRPEGVYRQVLDNECDLGIVSYPRRWRKVAIVPLRDEVMVVVCHPGHALAQRQGIQARELTPYSMVTFEPELPVGRQIRKYLKEQGAAPPITNVFDNLDTIKSAVAVTDQFSILPGRTVKRDVLSGALTMVELLPKLVRPIGVISRTKSRNGSTLSWPAQRFFDFLLDHAGRKAKMDLIDFHPVESEPLAGQRT